jgi:hypothetical protein
VVLGNKIDVDESRRQVCPSKCQTYVFYAHILCR